MSKEMPPRVWVTPEWKDIGKSIHRHLAFTRPDYERHELGVPYVPEKSVEEALSLALAEAFEEAARRMTDFFPRANALNQYWGPKQELAHQLHDEFHNLAKAARSSSGGEG